MPIQYLMHKGRQGALISHITETFYLLQTTLCPFLSILGAKSIATVYLGSEKEAGEHWCETDFLNRIPHPPLWAE